MKFRENFTIHILQPLFSALLHLISAAHRLHRQRHAIEELVALPPGIRVGRWTITKKLGAGAFGAVYLCVNDEGVQAALKTEPVNTPHPLLVMEAHVMTKLDTLRDGKHFCRCLDLGRDEQRDQQSGQMKKFNYIVMSLVGRGLDGVVKEAGGRLSLGSAVGVSIQMLAALRGLHTVGYLHRDIKPGNSTIGRPESNEIRLLYLIDFGMARKYTKDDVREPTSDANPNPKPEVFLDPKPEPEICRVPDPKPEPEIFLNPRHRQKKYAPHVLKVKCVFLNPKPELEIFRVPDPKPEPEIFLNPRHHWSQHRPRAATNFRGSPRYAAISAHLGREYSRKDDIESWFYCMIELFKGALPWSNVGEMKAIGDAKVKRQKKQPEAVRRQAIADLLSGCPSEFGQVLKYIDDMKYTDKPDYDWIIATLRSSLSNAGVQEFPYDLETGKRNAAPGAGGGGGGGGGDSYFN
ncbi:hypothetical protein niasHT_028214 [Heterodera trifolii]|uniref:Protein kinase domain-containing protein n=1 Tax=Heterodera trifolii TaxID=157864 RepID=A0ABD2K8T8_9BILA